MLITAAISVVVTHAAFVIQRSIKVQTSHFSSCHIKMMPEAVLTIQAPRTSEAALQPGAKSKAGKKHPWGVQPWTFLIISNGYDFCYHWFFSLINLNSHNKSLLSIIIFLLPHPFSESLIPFVAMHHSKTLDPMKIEVHMLDKIFDYKQSHFEAIETWNELHKSCVNSVQESMILQSTC